MFGRLAYLLDVFRRKPASSAGKGAAATVTVDAGGVRRTLADGRVEAVQWEALESVDLLGSDEGPFVDDLFWLLRSADGGCVVPGSDPAAAALLARLQALPGFDNEGLIRALASTENARFRLWQRRDPGAGSAKPLP